MVEAQLKEYTDKYDEIERLSQNIGKLYLVAQANANYHFIGWSDGVMDLTRTFVATKDMTLTAYFALDKYLVVLSAENGIVTINGEDYILFYIRLLL